MKASSFFRRTRKRRQIRKPGTRRDPVVQRAQRKGIAFTQEVKP